MRFFRFHGRSRGFAGGGALRCLRQLRLPVEFFKIERVNVSAHVRRTGNNSTPRNTQPSLRVLPCRLAFPPSAGLPHSVVGPAALLPRTVCRHIRLDRLLHFFQTSCRLASFGQATAFSNLPSGGEAGMCRVLRRFRSRCAYLVFTRVFFPSLGRFSPASKIGCRILKQKGRQADIFSACLSPYARFPSCS